MSSYKYHFLTWAIALGLVYVFLMYLVTSITAGGMPLSQVLYGILVVVMASNIPALATYGLWTLITKE